jgi:MSHA pilin protein MshC
MVLLILGILSYFVATRIFSGESPDQNAEMELVKNHLRYAQSRAMNTEARWGIKFDTPTRYWLYKDSATGTIIRLPGVETTDGSVALASIQLSGYPTAVTFDSFGSPGGTTITFSTTAGNITVTKNTGFIP